MIEKRLKVDNAVIDKIELHEFHRHLPNLNIMKMILNINWL